MTPEEHQGFSKFVQERESIPWKGIVWHHSATKDGSHRDYEAISRYHTSYRIDGAIVAYPDWLKRKEISDGKRFEEPWKSIGYHVLTERVGDRIVWLPGRNFTEKGAHAKGFNKTHLGICCVGNFDKEPIPEDMWDYCLSITRVLLHFFELSKESVIGHREVFQKLGLPVEKQCPGAYFSMEALRREI